MKKVISFKSKLKFYFLAFRKYRNRDKVVVIINEYSKKIRIYDKEDCLYIGLSKGMKPNMIIRIIKSLKPIGEIR